MLHRGSVWLGLLGGFFMLTGSIAAETGFKIESGLSPYQVYQRSAQGTADVSLTGTSDRAGLLQATVFQEGLPLAAFEKVKLGPIEAGSWKANLASLPMGGPYKIELQILSAEGSRLAGVTVEPVLVGDLWLLAGQSNMEGVGNMVEVEAPSDRVHVYRMRHEWDQAIEPIHRLYESPDSIHLAGQAPLSREEADAKAAQNSKGAGLGLPFAKQMVARTGIPIGLVPTAHGGTSMAQWNPELRDQGGDCLYGSMLKSLRAVGGKVAGVVWYQGESESGSLETVDGFQERFVRLVEAFRADIGNPDLPFYYVQISRFVVKGANPVWWNAVQEHQRVLEDRIPHSGMVAAVDLALDDLIHIGTPGLKRLGRRLANLAVGETSKGPRLDRVEAIPGGLRVAYREVNEKLLPEGRVAGFSIHDASGNDLPLIYNQEVDPTDPTRVLLHLSEKAPEGSLLYYGYGLDPFCNLTDSEDMAAPAFGPYELKD